MADDANQPPQPEEAAGAASEMTPEQMEEMQRQAELQLIGWVMHMAGCDQDRAIKAIQVAQHQEAQLGPYYEHLIDEKRRGTHPGFGVRIHWPDGRTRTDLPAAKKLDPKHYLVKEFGHDFGTELTHYTLAVCALTSPVGRALLIAQGYRIEFIETPWPKPKSRIIM